MVRQTVYDRKLADADPMGYVREHSVEEGECWIWQLPSHGKSYPIAFFGRETGARPSLRRWLWEHLHGKIGEGYRMITTCAEPMCVNPDHMKRVKHGEACRWGYKIGRVDHVRRRVSAAARARDMADITMNDVRAMRKMYGEGATTAEIAEKFGIAKGRVQKIVSHRAWVDTAHPFAGLLGFLSK